MVNLLKDYGVTTTEAQLAKICTTTNSRGTSNAQVLYELNAVLEEIELKKEVGYRFIPGNDHTTGLKEIAPCIATIKLSTFMNHAIYIKAVESDGFRVVDPLFGEYVIAPERFAMRSTGHFIYLK